MKIGLIDFDSKLVNFALMKVISYYKVRGDTVFLNPKKLSEMDKLYCSVVFDRNREKASRISELHPDIAFGGTGWDLSSILSPEIDRDEAQEETGKSSGYRTGEAVC